jgi:hypothetical protein
MPGMIRGMHRFCCGSGATLIPGIGRDAPEIRPRDKITVGHCLSPAVTCSRVGDQQYDLEDQELATASRPKGGEASGFPRSEPLAIHVGNGAGDTPCLSAFPFFSRCTQLYHWPESNQ